MTKTGLTGLGEESLKKRFLQNDINLD